MKRVPASILLWEGLPFAAALLAQLLCLVSHAYRKFWFHQWFFNSGETTLQFAVLLFTVLILFFAATILRLLRIWWPAPDTPDRSFHIVFPSASAIFLTMIAAFLILIAPAWFRLDSYGRWQAEQSQSP
jgi:hypothetical protein